MLKVEYVRDAKNLIIGSKASGFGNGDTVARDRVGKILGHSNSKFGNTRDAIGFPALRGLFPQGSHNWAVRF